MGSPVRFAHGWTTRATLPLAMLLVATAAAPAVSHSLELDDRRSGSGTLMAGQRPASVWSVMAAPAPGASAPVPVADPAYYRPVVFGGKAFPVARSNFLSLLRFRNDWHAPRLRLIGGVWRLVGLHEGIDIAAERGTPVLSMTAGTVENAGWTFYSGTRVGIRGDDGRYYLYAHLSALGPRIVPGGRVVAGQLLGRVGNTGYGDPGHRDEFPPHLHFGVQAGSVWVSPFRTLVELYRATVERNRLDQAALDELALSGGSAAWRQASAALYADFTLAFWE